MTEETKNTPPLVVRMDSVVYDVQDKRVLDGVNLDVEDNQIMAVLGRSGSGKTTILRLIMGLIRPVSGRIRINGKEITGLPEQDLLRVRERMGLVFQNAALFDSLTVGENVGFGLREHRKADDEEIERQVKEKLAMVGLAGTEHLMPAELSGGMRKRVGVARALVTAPEIMLYDEPTAGLDPPTSASLNDLISELRDNLGVTTVIVSHDIHSLAQITDRAAMLEKGKIVAVGTLDELAESERPEVRGFFRFWKGEER